MKKPTTLKQAIKEELKDNEFKLLFEKETCIINIAKIITDLRQKSGLTQDALAKKCHTTQSVIARIESGNDTRIPSLELLNRIAISLGSHLSIVFEKAA